MFGGYDDSSYKDDMWELVLTKFENDHVTYSTAHENQCLWRTRTDSSAYTQWLTSCGATSPNQPCSLNSILYMAYCKSEWQSLQSFVVNT